MSQQPPLGGPHPGFRPPPPANGHAIAALVLGVVSLTGCSFVTGIPAMVIGRMAKREIAESDGATSGQELATIGVVCGLVATVLGVLAIVGVVLFFVLGVYVFDTCGDGRC
jgi:disulfide bond formation protein DsbB